MKVPATSITTGKDVSVDSGQCVLVIDSQEETEEVLKAVLEPRGLKVDRIQHSPSSRSHAKSSSLVVRFASNESSSIPENSNWENIPRVIIGSATMVEPESDAFPICERYLQKPFQYGELIHAIEHLLSEPSA